MKVSKKQAKRQRKKELREQRGRDPNWKPIPSQVHNSAKMARLIGVLHPNAVTGNTQTEATTGDTQTLAITGSNTKLLAANVDTLTQAAPDNTQTQLVITNPDDMDMHEGMEAMKLD